MIQFFHTDAIESYCLYLDRSRDYELPVGLKSSKRENIGNELNNIRMHQLRWVS